MTVLAAILFALVIAAWGIGFGIILFKDSVKPDHVWPRPLQYLASMAAFAASLVLLLFSTLLAIEYLSKP